MNKYKLTNLVFFALSLLVLASTWIYWESVCKAGGCDFNLMEEVLRPATQGSLVLSVVLGVFIFLPSHYFEKWLKWIFTWLLPLYLILIYQLGDNSSNILSFSYALVAQLLGYVFGGVSLVFVVTRFVYVHYFKKQS